MIRRVAVAAVTLLVALGPAAPVQAEQAQFVVMSRNIYLGADVGIAMDLLPDFPAATQFMWDQMRQTDFESRSSGFVDEIALEQPDVIGIQEGTRWYCQSGPLADEVVVFDFVQILLNQLSGAGLNYEIASHDGQIAQNVGFKIAPIPLLTKATDPEIFPSRFGSESAYCGFEIADVLLIKSSLAESVLAVGTTEYQEKYTIIPTVMSVYRGFSWADVSISEKPVRFVTTHLESLYSEDGTPTAKIQADQLISDLAATKIPIVLMGDFNSDPRDPRPDIGPNPGQQPSENSACTKQVLNPNLETADSTCNAFWTIMQSGFQSVGPDEADPRHYTWGMNALLTGPDPSRLPAAIEMGNPTGFTDRLDYIFVKGPINVLQAKLVGQSADQKWVSDHAGIVARFEISQPIEYQEVRLAEHTRFPLGFWQLVGFGLVALAGFGIARKRRKKRKLN